MTKLTPGQAQTYEYIKQQGECLFKHIVKDTKQRMNTVDGHCTILMKHGMVEKRGKIKERIFKAIDLPYEVVQYNYKAPEKLFNPDTQDPYLLSLLNVELSEEQSFYLQNHKQMKRTLLAKRLGLSKPQLNFCLERLG